MKTLEMGYLITKHRKISTKLEHYLPYKTW